MINQLICFGNFRSHSLKVTIPLVVAFSVVPYEKDKKDEWPSDHQFLSPLIVGSIQQMYWITHISSQIPHSSDLFKGSWLKCAPGKEQEGWGLWKGTVAGSQHFAVVLIPVFITAFSFVLARHFVLTPVPQTLASMIIFLWALHFHPQNFPYGNAN